MAGSDFDSGNPLVVTWVAVVVGVALVAVPTLVSEIVWPRWAATYVSSTAESGLALFGALLGLSGLCVAAVGVWVGFSVAPDFGSGVQIMLRMYGGVVFATLASITFLGFERAPLETMFIAPIVAVLVGIPFWVFAGAGLAVGSIMYDP
ncbi:MAG: hypothetical protein ACN4GK_12780 [Acidimicrobiia bacterium]